MHEARFYEKLSANQIRCGLCNHHCTIVDTKRGLCGVRENRGGSLFSLVYGKTVAEHIDPIEKKPLFHVLPGSLSYSISTVGCNFKCDHCQNFEISQSPQKGAAEITGHLRTPAEIVAAAEAARCRSISYTYVEPTIFYEFAYDCAVAARQSGLKNVFVSNGYMSPAAGRDLAPVLDGINIDIKAFTEQFYHQVCKARLAPVLDTVRLLHGLGVWVEITTLIIPGLNDSLAELREIARFIYSVDPAMPWHVTAFHPTYKMLDRQPTPASILHKAREIGHEEGLRFVYNGNIPGAGGENTTCPSCGTLLIERLGFKIIDNRLEDGHCPSCKEAIEGVWS
ncbi:MAG: AmmeMemoRadiSam system radical SAM enzyme [Proteobacteria bacterium]|nr:AmmeMemoRadiSam system radical SAM enzyme [Pseudomonadota bacterium]MBU1686919.1 AmmeMemoRadiSam system radical SAM enzyme [Pseudomonadota bacterium]